ncbi:hypothetical protein AB0M87_02505 [Streptomyces sp. NPDC051320]|uniref:hypothetical protein n=1 Tax=Streptomyces sp. NPDC051320 TaxID=3154644 RepID=UPI0034441B5F
MLTFASAWPFYIVLLVGVTGCLAWIAAAFALVVVLVRGIFRLVARRRQAPPEPVTEPADDWQAFVYERCHTTSCAHLDRPHQVQEDGSLVCLSCHHVVPAA